MASQPILAPSILSADFTRLGEQITEVEQAGAGWIHVDVMDGHFVPPISFGQVVLEACRPVTQLPLDVHLMVQDPDPMLASFADAGADQITVHVEACRHIHRSLQTIRQLGCKVGVALNPGTPAGALSELLPLVDVVLVMSVNPGYSGQAFIPEVLPKVVALRQMISALGSQALIEMDGGIDAQTMPAALAAGVQVFVAGSAVFSHAQGPAAGLAALQRVTT